MKRKTNKIRQLILVYLSIIILLTLFVSPALAQTVSSTKLIEKCRFYNGKEVAYQGEVVGDIMVRGKNAWISVNDDPYSSRNVEEGAKLRGYNSGQTIWCNASQVKFIKYKGDYKNSGDIVQVKGIFNRACPKHGGDMDIHASDVKLIKRGHPIPHLFNWQRALIALLLGALSLALFLANRALGPRKIPESQSGCS